MSYPYSNEELYKMFRDSNEPNFVKFLLKLDEKLEKQEEIPPCESCERNGQPNCGNSHCVTRQND